MFRENGCALFAEHSHRWSGPTSSLALPRIDGPHSIPLGGTVKTCLLVALVWLPISSAFPTFAQQKDTVHAGQVLAFSFQSTTLGRDWPYKVYLPDGYDKSNLRYPVLFLLHGLNQDESTWVSEGKINEVADQEIAAGNIAPLLLSCQDRVTTSMSTLRRKLKPLSLTTLSPR